MSIENTNIISPDYSPGSAGSSAGTIGSCPVIQGKEKIAESYAQYIVDESRHSGSVPERIYFPETTGQVAQAVREVRARAEDLTISGARTGIVGGAVPHTATLLSLERMKAVPKIWFDSIHSCWTASIPAGTPLSDLNEMLKSGQFEIDDRSAENTPPEKLFYPIDPTETSASLGGTVATNASGARTLLYGPTRNWVTGLTVVLGSGGVLHIERGRTTAADGVFILEGEDGSRSDILVPNLPIPDTKHTAGYHLKSDMDLVDLFIGSEGTLGIVTEIDFRLTAEPEQRICLVIFLPEDNPVKLVSELKSLKPAAIEYFDERSIQILIRSKEEKLDGGAVPDIPDQTKAALYIELEAENDEQIEEVYVELEEILSGAGVSLDATWAGFESKDMEAMKKFRHILPERINSIIAERKKSLPELSKIGTDMAVPDSALDTMMELYRTCLEKENIEYCVFGHIGNGHLHVNILPKSMEERSRGYALYKIFAEKAVELQGSVAGEHGIGRLKKDFMTIQYSAGELQAMKDIKTALDPDSVLNSGVLF